MRSVFSLVLLLSICFPCLSQNGHDIKINLNGYTEDVLYLAYHLGNKQYVKDTASREPDNSFVFKSDEPLDAGNYILVFAPDNTTFEFLLSEDEQHFVINLDVDNMMETVEITGPSKENELFFDYLKYLTDRRKEAKSIQDESSRSSDGSGDQEQQQKMNVLNDKVVAYQKKLIVVNPGSLAATIVRASMDIDYPDVEGTESEQQVKLWRYAQQHYFDNMDLGDARLLRTPMLHSKVDYFINKLQVQHPDTISLAIDQLLSQMKPAEETYKHYVIHFLNEYAKSKTVGMDAVYVHMVEQYYTNGKAPWVEASQLEKILDDAARLKPLLIGKTAPNIELAGRNGEVFNLHDLEAEYTVLYFWRYDCDHCKESTPDLAKFYKEFKDQGVKMLAVCTKGASELDGCWAYADENKLDGWILASSAPGQNLEHGPFHVQSTPLIFVLDKDKMIQSKRLGASQLAEVMTRLINR